MIRDNLQPTDAELQILQILWHYGPSTVRDVNDRINEQRADDTKESGYTTTLKLMQIMADKGLVIRDTSQRTHVYTAAIEEHDVQSSLLSSFLHAAYRGSTKSLVMQALGDHKASKEELAEIKALISKLEEKS